MSADSERLEFILLLLTRLLRSMATGFIGFVYWILSLIYEMIPSELKQ
jgi:hypothetical protein